MSIDEDAVKADFAQFTLGPIFFAACHRLWLYQTTFVENKTVALFASRGGLRFLDLYRDFLTQQRLEPPITCSPFMVSRLSVSLVSWRRAPTIVINNLLREFCGQNLETIAPCLLPGMAVSVVQKLVQSIDVDLRRKKIDALAFHQLINGQSSFAEALRQYLREQESLFDIYLKKLAVNSKVLILCDTGLFGISQLILMAAWPEYSWHGLYLGRSNYRGEAAPHFGEVNGLILERDRESRAYPETALLRHWHIVEMPLEADIPSASFYFEEQGKSCCNTEIPDWQAKVESLENSYYRGIKAYFAGQDQPLDASEIYRRRRKALLALQKNICMPSLEDTRRLAMGNRCADLGRSSVVPVVDLRKHRLFLKLRAIRSALWKEGQIRAEFPHLGWAINFSWFHLRCLLGR